MEWKSEFFNNRKEEDSDEIEAYGCIFALFFFFREKYVEGCTGTRKKRTMQRKQKERRENRTLFARPCVYRHARFLPTPYASWPAHVLS